MNYQEATIRHAFISLTKFIDSLIDAEVLSERNEVYLLFSNWRTNNNFSHRWTIEHPNYYVKRGAEMINIDKEVKKTLPTVKFIDLPLNASLNPSTLTRVYLNFMTTFELILMPTSSGVSVSPSEDWRSQVRFT